MNNKTKKHTRKKHTRKRNRLPARTIPLILKETAIKWQANQAPMYGAALAYYALFSIAPLLVLALAVAASIYGAEAAQGELQEHLVQYLGPDGAKSVQALLVSADNKDGRGTVAFVIGGAVLLFGAQTVFSQLKDVINKMWHVDEPKHTGVKAFFVDRLLAILMVATVGVLLVLSLLVSTVISVLANMVGHVLPVPPEMLHLLDLGISFLLLSILFAIIFKVLPDVKIGWQSVLLGAVFTSILFAVGKFLIGLYIAKGGLSSSYGAAGSVVVLLVWVYYSAQIFLFGAQFTYVYSRMRHLPIEPIVEEPSDGEQATGA